MPLDFGFPAHLSDNRFQPFPAIPLSDRFGALGMSPNSLIQT